MAYLKELQNFKAHYLGAFLTQMEFEQLVRIASKKNITLNECFRCILVFFIDILEKFPANAFSLVSDKLKRKLEIEVRSGLIVSDQKVCPNAPSFCVDSEYKDRIENSSFNGDLNCFATWAMWLFGVCYSLNERDSWFIKSLETDPQHLKVNCNLTEIINEKFPPSAPFSVEEKDSLVFTHRGKVTLSPEEESKFINLFASTQYSSEEKQEITRKIKDLPEVNLKVVEQIIYLQRIRALSFEEAEGFDGVTAKKIQWTPQAKKGIKG